MSKRAKHVEPSLTKVWICSGVCRKRQKIDIDIMPCIKELYSRDGCGRAVKKLRDLNERSIYISIWKTWKRRITLFKVKRSIYISIWKTWKRRITLFKVKRRLRIDVKALLSLDSVYNTVFLDPNIKLCWQALVQNISESKASWQSYDYWEAHSHPDIMNM
jgi:hypothetical protein